MKIYIASQNKTKVEAVKLVFKEASVIALKIDSKVSDQPKSEKETMLGAYNRAKSLPKDGLRIGLEAGVSLEEDILFLINWGVLIDQDDNVYLASGTKIPLPKFIYDEIYNQGKELADIMNYHYNKEEINTKEGAIGIFTNDNVQRIEIFIHIVKLLKGQYETKNYVGRINK